MIDEAEQFTRSLKLKSQCVEDKHHQLSHQKQIFLRKIIKHYPEDFTLSKYHLVHEVKKYANNENKELTRVATYEQFLAECGDLNKELIEILELRNTLNLLRRDKGIIGSDIPVQKFDPQKHKILNEDVMQEYERLVRNHEAEIFVDIDKNLDDFVDLSYEEDNARITNRHKISIEALRFKKKTKKKNEEVIRDDDDKIRKSYIQPHAKYVPMFPTEDFVDADEYERKHNDEIQNMRAVNKVQNLMEELKINRYLEQHSHINQTQKKHDQVTKNSDFNNQQKMPQKQSKPKEKQMIEISAEQAWKNWEDFEESIKKPTMKQKQIMMEDLDKIDFFDP